MISAGTVLAILDCDGVLIDSEPLACETLASMLAATGHEMTTSEAVEAFAGISWRDCKLVIERQLGTPLDDNFESRYEDALKQKFIAQLRPVEGIFRTLEAIAELNVSACIASSSTLKRLRLSLGIVNLWDAFAPHIFSASMVGRGKPAPDLFLYAAEKMGHAPDRCVVIEDSVAGVLASLAAGMYTIGYCGGSHCDPAHAHRLKKAGAHEVIGDMHMAVDLVRRFSEN